MSLNTILTNIVDQIPGALGAILVDWEGEAVEHVSHMDDFELKLLGAHHGIILENLRQVAQRLDKTDVEEIVVQARRLRVLISPVSPEYFLVLTLQRRSLIAHARSVVESYRERLRLEIC
ncbi:Predicted regulator of Ras-like GTPase activity, Roadblock/LC7/MglB family [Geoalkalibacter ferrihydriticus]|uniref:Roadblock/LAMTOR2 domain-containing protein n=2 Tax=Geoalkalibacter ferrihydriticus TaxID=392333 RepID=A0A0C2HQ89_9BACT|nr:roadblock/LC7 domain-containing protein [Geoalkalibacter ferrihydriticus]KIH77055.1 hypothetical protein GFER_08420 [Geoalkalibacter ferrihydriticus DSM 17813]SDL37067.1 Predicted regulator of Ras-like GTPase activity, Roadblock/LC7/MglB family [Geoalkalibacter ferrihydriticus]